LELGHSEGAEGSIMRKSIPAKDTHEAILGSRLTPWLPEAEWEWHDRVRSNLWPCERPPERSTAPAPPGSSSPRLPEDQA